VSSLDLGLIGNSAIGALLNPSAEIVWACFPRFDGDAMFCTEALDASMLLRHELGFLAADDPRFAATVGAIERELKQGDFVFRYAEADGELSACSNPNGSINNIAGISNKEGNVVGLMPHPERVMESVLGGTDGIRVFKSLIEWCGKGGYLK